MRGSAAWSSCCWSTRWPTTMERRAALREALERFAEQDPYLLHELVTSWTVRAWNVVLG